MGKIFYLMGKSASGKDHIYEHLLKQADLELKPLILYTTRPIRSGEENGREYFFVTEERLARLRREGKIIEERMYQTVHGPWYYFTADDGQICPEKYDYLGIGTLDSYQKMKAHFGEKILVPLYVETEDGIRLARALKRERKQEQPKYAEMCRRFLADCEDFAEEKIRKAGILKRFSNNGVIEDCFSEIQNFVEQEKKLCYNERK
ncbi:MAG: guanylate kinase [Fusicatenibacter sp.]|nr:guanylate kinase [Fusicatenibacter sp.]